MVTAQVGADPRRDFSRLTLMQQQEIESLLRARSGETLDAFIRRVTPRFPPPRHVQPLMRLFERARRKPIRALVSMPPRHAKSETVFNGLAWWMRHSPADTHAYVTYSDDIASSQSRKIRQRAIEGGVSISREMRNLGEWRTDADGGLFAVGVDVGLTGKGITGIAVVDDPYAGIVQASSAKIRASRWDWFTGTLMARLEHASVLVQHCIAEGERVPMADGTWKRIEEIAPGDSVVGYDTATHRTVGKRVLDQRCSGDDDIFEIKTDHYTLRCNAAHPILVVPEDGKTKRALTYEWRQTRDLRAGDMVVGLKSYDNGATLEGLKKKGIPADDAFGWLFGFLLGDGWVTRHERKNQGGAVSWAVCCALSDPARAYPRPKPKPNQRRVASEPQSGSENNERFISLMEFFFGSKPYATGFGYMRCDDNAAGRFLSQLGLAAGKNAKTKTIPQWVFEAPLSFRREVLRGLLDADGCKPKKGRSYRFGSASPELVHGARRLAMMSGARATCAGRREDLVQPPHSSEPVKSVMTFSDVLVDGIDVEPEGVGCVKNWTGLDVRLVKVREVRPVGRARIFDLTVEGVENFFPGGLCAHNTRWHKDDLIGQLAKDQGWEYVNLPALAEEGDLLGRAVGEPLWPEERTLAQLLEKKAIDEFVFAALYQGQPRPRGHTVFAREPARFDLATHDPAGWRLFLSGDPAATDDTSGDFSALLALAVQGEGARQRGRVLDVFRRQITVPDFADWVIRFQDRHGGAPVGIEAVGGFKAVPQILKRVKPGIRIQEVHPVGDKFTRAQPVATAWNDGRIEVPTQAPWVSDFLAEVMAFTGISDAHDDQVDVLSQGWHMAASEIKPPTFTRPSGPILPRRR